MPSAPGAKHEKKVQKKPMVAAQKVRMCGWPVEQSVRHRAHHGLVLRVDRELELAAEDVGGLARVDAARLEGRVERVDLLRGGRFE